MTSQPIRLSTNFMTLIPSLTFTDYEWFPWSICNGCGMPAGNAYPSGHLVPSPILGLASAPIVETKFLELAMSLLDFSPRIPLGTFSILPFAFSAVWGIPVHVHYRDMYRRDPEVWRLQSVWWQLTRLCFAFSAVWRVPVHVHYRDMYRRDPDVIIS